MRYRIRADARAVILGEGDVVLGRSPYSTLAVDQGTVSRVHAMFRKAGDGVELVDLDSSNGTFVNGRRISAPTSVKAGDEIKIGTQRVFLDAMAIRSTIDTGRIVIQLPTDDDDSQSGGATLVGRLDP